MKKKIISTVLAVAAVLSLAGCNSDSGITVNTSSSSSASNGSSANNSSDSSANSIATSSSDTSGNSDTSSSNTATSSSASSSSADSNTSSDNTPSADNVAAVLNAPLPIVYKDSVPDFPAVDENAPVPTSLEFLKATGTNIDNSDSVIIKGTIEGVTYAWGKCENISVKQTYTFVATKDTTYLRVAYQDDKYTPSVIAYEEYRVLNDNGTYSTITKSGDKWVATPSEYYLLGLSDKRDPNGSRINYDDSKLLFEYNGSNLYENSIRTIGMLRLFASDFITKDRFGEDDMIVSMPIVRDETKNLILKVDDWAGFRTSDKMFEAGELCYEYKALSNFFRYSPDELQLLETNNRGVDGYTKGSKISHIVSPNYLLETITGHIGDKFDVSLDFTLEFSDWNGVAKINVPDYVTE